MGVSCIECLALVSIWKVENLDAMNGGVVGVFIAPTTKLAVWWRLLSHGAPDSPVCHRTLSGAPATSAGCWVLTVGALTGGASGLSGGALNAVAVDRWHEVVVAPLAHRTVRCAPDMFGEL